MKSVRKLIKGMIVGIGSLIPGLSGSLIAIFLNIYQDLLNALNRVLKEPKKAIFSIWQYIVGIIIGFGLGFIFVRFLFEKLPLPFAFLISGLIIGAIPLIYAKTKQEKCRWHHLLVMIISIGMITSLAFFQNQNGDEQNNTFVLFLIGFIYAGALIVPGLSGSTLLLVFGFFSTFLWMGNTMIDGLVSLDFVQSVKMLPSLLVFASGLIMGLLVMGKFMHIVLINYQTHFYYGVLGMMIASPINIFLQIPSIGTSLFSSSWILGLSIVWLILGFLLSLKLSKVSKNKSNAPISS